MKNELTEADEREYRETMWERRLEREQRMREDAMDCFDTGDDDE